MARYFLGFDSSTQSLSALIIDVDAGTVVGEYSLNFSEELPHYGTAHGVLPCDDARIVHAPPMMWAEALDVLFTRMQAGGAPLGEVLAVSGSGQQHGSVYLTAAAPKRIGNAAPSQTLTDVLQGCLARRTAPIWMDSSTTTECEEIMAALGGPAATAEATGSIAFERFTGPQIRKFYKEGRAAYEETAAVCLVSSFMASLLGGAIVPIDHGDAAGMNLMDIRARTWHPAALEATAPGLAARLAPPVPSWTITGKVSAYFAKYGLNPDAVNVVWSGDNPNSLIGLGLVEPGAVAISLGTSDTFFGVMRECRVDPRGEGHVFVSPTGDYMSLICFKNGSLAREKIRDLYSLDWAEFTNAVLAEPPGNNGKLLLPWFEPEIVPKVLLPGVRRIGLEPDDATGNCRAVVEAQMLSMRLHSQWMQVRPTHIYATGGASRDVAILRIMADVNQCPVHRLKTSNSAALGAAMRAAHAWSQTSNHPLDWKTLATMYAQPSPEAVVHPNPETTYVYAEMLEQFAKHEAAALQA